MIEYNALEIDSRSELFTRRSALTALGAAFALVTLVPSATAQSRSRATKSHTP